MRMFGNYKSISTLNMVFLNSPLPSPSSPLSLDSSLHPSTLITPPPVSPSGFCTPNSFSFTFPSIDVCAQVSWLTPIAWELFCGTNCACTGNGNPRGWNTLRLLRHNEAYYIPDGCVGPVCLFPEGFSCWDIQERHGWDGVILLRVRIFSKFKFFCLASKSLPVLEVQGITDIISDFLIHV